MQRRPENPGTEAARPRREGINFRPAWGTRPQRFYGPGDYEEEVEPASGPYAGRRRVEARSAPIPQFRRQRSSGRESSGLGPSAEGPVIVETPAPVPYEGSSDDEDDRRFGRRRRFEEEFNGRNSDREDARPRSVAGDEVIVERRDGRRPYGSVNPAGYGDPFYRPPSPVMDDIDTFDDFHFVFPAEESSKDAELSDLDTPATESESTQKVERPLSTVLAAPGIYSSSYSGTAELGAQHDVNLTILLNPSGHKQPLFRWL